MGFGNESASSKHCVGAQHCVRRPAAPATLWRFNGFPNSSPLPYVPPRIKRRVRLLQRLRERQALLLRRRAPRMHAVAACLWHQAGGRALFASCTPQAAASRTSAGAVPLIPPAAAAAATAAAAAPLRKLMPHPGSGTQPHAAPPPRSARSSVWRKLHIWWASAARANGSSGWDASAPMPGGSRAWRGARAGRRGWRGAAHSR
jgi:hypothetical protein